MDTDLQATDPSLQFMTSGVLDTTFYATYKKWLLYRTQDRKSTRQNSSHEWHSYAVFC